ncbi:MAG: nitrite/sulfite reductase [Lentisphaeria bacterium]|nr:nitrite/sulfite reductase [Lentisphaeria bacterium]
MQRKLTFEKVSEDEEIKAAGLTLDFDEIARKGSMSREESAIAKWYGIYGSRQTGNYMARMVVPGGIITSAQARLIAKTAEDFAQGRINITTRQSLQFHWLQLKDLPRVLRQLAEETISCFHGCGDVTRNVAACPLAETCAYRRFNVRPYALESARLLTSSRDLDNLPRKYKVTWSGCPGACAQPYMNCVGMIAVKKATGEEGFKVVIGGGMGWKGFVARELFSFVPADKAVVLTRAIALLFRDYGDRFNRAKARLKFVVDRLGVDTCRDIILRYCADEHVDTSGFDTAPVAEAGPAVPENPLTETFMKHDDEGTVRIMVPKGEMDHVQLFRVAELAEMYGDQRVYTTNRQNLELHGVSENRVDTVKTELAKIGFATEGVYGLPDMVACVGTTYCPKAVATTRELFERLQPLVNAPVFAGIRDFATINITGCPNACSPYRIADIGFRGMRIREETGSVEGYEMLIGGSQTKHGVKLGDFKTTDCVEITGKVLAHFMAVRQDNETLRGCVERVGVEKFKEVIML